MDSCLSSTIICFKNEKKFSVLPFFTNNGIFLGFCCVFLSSQDLLEWSFSHGHAFSYNNEAKEAVALSEKPKTKRNLQK